MATAVERYTMPPEFVQGKNNNLIPNVLTVESPTPSPTPTEDVSLPRAASYTHFPPVKTSLLDDSSNPTEHGSFSVEDLLPDIFSTEGTFLEPSPTSSGETTPDSEPVTPLETTNENGNGLEKPKSAVLTNGLPKLATANAATERSKTPVERTGADELTELPSPVSNSLSSRLRRRSWMPSSRSPSPRKQAARAESPVEGPSSGRPARVGRRNSFRRSMGIEVTEKPKEKPNEKQTRSRSTSLSRRLSNKIRGRPLDTITDGVTSHNTTPVPILDPKLLQLPKSFSTEKLPVSTLNRPVPVLERVPQLPRASSQERHRLPKVSSRKRDELWSVFRTLDGEHQKFQSKPAALKTNVVRTSLLPFLRTYHTHPSVFKLRPEDLDRRAVILNRWWTGLLELLLNNQSISGTERPSLFEGILGIMERPEWRLPPSPFCPTSERNPLHPDNRSTSSASLSSQSSDYVVESVNHNVRNIFSQNILGQMGFVVEKMSMRNAPASLVTFCGKTCAYAFFFCPGIADVLVRLWNPTMDLLNRVLVECDLPRSANLTDTSKAVGAGFPPHLQSLQYTTLSATYRSLRKPAPLPLGTHHLPWSGVWVNRWTGKDSDLFYVFVKYYHLLLTEFLMPKATRKERLCAPGLIFVHAQVLANMDLTIHRNGSVTEETRQGASNITFDDVLSEPDATAPTLPLPPMTNATRLMAENRLIMLVRDFLSERSPNPPWARHIFAQAFADLLKAAARRTSTYDHNACYILCDFLEEAVFLLVRYEQSNPTESSFIDWSFWMDSWQQMVQSHNTTTEIRLYALLYSLWTPIAIDPDRRAAICSSFLLEADFFQSRFNHWCPMVRSYYMRLLCWRVARYDGEDLDGDTYVYERLSVHLQKTYSHYLYLQQQAQESELQAPSTSPCNPAPGRRLLIVRTDPLFSQQRGSHLSFEGFASQQANGYKRNSTFGEISTLNMRPDSGGSSGNSDSDPDVDERSPGKKWGLLRTIIGTSKQDHRNKSPHKRSSDEAKPTSLPQNNKVPRSTGPMNGNGAPPRSMLNNGPEHRHHQSNHRTFSFKFSLEWVDRLDRRLHVPGPMRIMPPRLPLAAQQLLQSRPVSIASSDSGGKSIEIKGIEPTGAAKASSKYSGRALAEWTLVVSECQSFFERRKAEGVPGNRWVETPSLGVEAFKRPG